MGQPKIQASFNSGEWAPSLYARVDVEKYKSAAALLRNFFVDYRGGASSRPGTKYILQAYISDQPVRLIPFEASFTVSYVLEFGDRYLRFFNNGAPVLETGLNITGVTKANPCVVSVTNSYAVGEWVYISGVSGMTQLNGRYFIVAARAAGSITLDDLFGNPVDSTNYGTWTSGGTTKRVYTITTPFAADDLFLLKYVQDVGDMIITHPDYAPYRLTIVSAANWVLAPISFGATINAPSGFSTSTTLSAGTTDYSYIVTAVDALGQESVQSTTVGFDNYSLLSSGNGTNSITWAAVPGAVSYNIYKAEIALSGASVPAGSAYGFIGNQTGTTFIDSNIAPDFSRGPPSARYPFITGAPVESVTVGTAGTYTTTPTVSFAAAPTNGTTASGLAIMKGVSATVAAGGTGYVVGDTLTFQGNIIFTVATLSGSAIATVTLANAGAITGSVPANPRSAESTSGAGAGATLDITYGVLSIDLLNPGAGYLTAPAITFSAGAAAATAVLGPSNANNPAVPTFFQQRLVLGGAYASPQTLYMSQPGRYYNFNVSSPVADSDSITATIASGQLNNIKSMVPQPGGLIVFTDGASFLINGGSAGSAVTPSAISANAQSFDGANDLPPIVANYDILFVTAKGSSVRDSTYNFYANVFSSADISVLSSHLFFGYTLIQWAWAQEPYKVVWAVRDDGTMLTLTFVKDQDFIGWAHSDTDGSFTSVASVVELADQGYVNAVYAVVEREVNSQTVKYIERFAERYYPNGVVDAWCVDSGLQYDGAPETDFTGGEHLAGLTVTGLADGEVIPEFTMPASGEFSLATAASKVTVGLPFTCQLKTMALDLGEPTAQGKVKKITAVDVRVCETLGLEIGASFNTLVPMKDLIVGNVSSMLVGQDSQIVTDLVTGDARTYMNPTYTVPGQYCIQQSQPFPATILGVIPLIELGDTRK